MKYIVTVHGKETSLRALCDATGANYWTAVNRYKRGIRDIDKLLLKERITITTSRKKKAKVHPCMNGVNASPTGDVRKGSEVSEVSEVKAVQLQDLLDKGTVRILGAIKVEHGLDTYEEAVDYLAGVWLGLQKQEPQIKAKKKLFGIW